MAETTAQRYSEKRLADSFSAYVLLSEELAFTPDEILEALRQDYPDLEWFDRLKMNLPFRTGQVGAIPFWPESKEADSKSANLITGPGQCDIEWEPLLYKSRFIFPEARAAVARHRTYLSIHVGSVDQSLASRFQAARRMTCLAALFAKLPICTAVYCPNGDTVVRPEKWVEAADKAIRGEVPMLEWITLWITAVPDGRQPVPMTAQTIGMAAFTGREIIMPAVRTEPAEVGNWVMCAGRLVLEHGHVFEDSNTLGLEGGDGPKIRIRHWPEGVHSAQTDMWALLHPDSIIDEMKYFGPRSKMPPPPGYDNTFRGDENFLRKLLARVVPRRVH